MRNTMLIILLTLVIGAGGFAQERKHFAHKRLEELEKLKLIEILNMNEETTLKFFARRNAHKEKMESLNDKLTDKAEKIQNMVKDNPDKAKLKIAVKDYLDLEAKMTKERADYIHSLPDILNEEQIAKVVIFERIFREQIREIIFRERGKNMQKDKKD
jgi:hypothetical protein